MMTSKEYANIGGVRCPVCDSLNLNAGRLEPTEFCKAYQNVYCDDCGAEWCDEYELVGYDSLTEPQN